LPLKGRGLRLSDLDTASADEVDDFQSILIMERSCRPVRATDDIAVEFYGNAVTLKTQQVDELYESREVLEVTGFAVDSEGHFSIASSQKSVASEIVKDGGGGAVLLREAKLLHCGLALVSSLDQDGGFGGGFQTDGKANFSATVDLSLRLSEDGLVFVAIAGRGNLGDQLSAEYGCAALQDAEAKSNGFTSRNGSEVQDFQ
jgi:hypothetical protein